MDLVMLHMVVLCKQPLETIQGNKSPISAPTFIAGLVPVISIEQPDEQAKVHD